MTGVAGVIEAGAGEAEPEGRLARRKARTRAAILGAASTLFRDQGFDQTSIQQIAEAAETGVGTVYGYFASKEEVLRAVLEEHSAEAVARYEAAVTSDTAALERLCLALATLGEYIAEHRTVLASGFLRGVAQHGSTRWVEKSISHFLREGIERGEIRAIPVDATARMLVGTVTVASLELGPWREGEPGSLDGIIAAVRALLAS